MKIKYYVQQVHVLRVENLVDPGFESSREYRQTKHKIGTSRGSCWGSDLHTNVLSDPSLSFGRGAVINSDIVASCSNMSSHWKPHHAQSQKSNFCHIILFLQLSECRPFSYQNHIVVHFAPIAPGHLAPPVYTETLLVGLRSILVTC